MMATGILEVELIERIYHFWESKACHKCGSNVNKRYEHTPPIKNKDKPLPMKIQSSRNLSLAANKFMDEEFSERCSDSSSIPTAHPEYEKQMQKYESENRANMKSEFEMKYWIEMMQEQLNDAKKCVVKLDEENKYIYQRNMQK